MYNRSHYKTNGYDVIHCFKWGFSIVEHFVYKWFSVLICSSEVPVADREGTVNQSKHHTMDHVQHPHRHPSNPQIQEDSCSISTMCWAIDKSHPRTCKILNILFIVCVGGGGCFVCCKFSNNYQKNSYKFKKNKLFGLFAILQFFFYNTETVINITTYAEILLCVLVFCDMKMIVKKNKIKLNIKLLINGMSITVDLFLQDIIKRENTRPNLAFSHWMFHLKIDT